MPERALCDQWHNDYRSEEARYDHRKQGLAAFIRPGRAHRRVYTDPAIFSLEMEKIFGSAWIYVGHESQVKRSRRLHRHENRAEAAAPRARYLGKLQLLHNRCAHRGRSSWPLRPVIHRASLLLSRLDLSSRRPAESGAAAADYPADFDPKNPDFRLRRVARLASYRGFVFGNLAADGPSLAEYLGYMTTSLDDMVDRAPDGEIEVAGGTFKHTYKANWKLYLENLCDAAHPLFTHQSSIDAASQQSDDVYSDGSGEIAIRQMRQNGAPYSFWETNVGIWTYPNGHSFLAIIMMTPSWWRR